MIQSDPRGEALVNSQPQAAVKLLEVKNLSKVYDNGIFALKNISFTIHRGEFLGIIGLSGSGKSTLLRCLNRLIEPTSGEILFHDPATGQVIDIAKLNVRELRDVRRHIGMIFQHFNLVKRKSVLMNVLSGRLALTSTWSSLFGWFSEAEHKEATDHLATVGLAEKAQNRADELSGGQQQRVAIARSLMQNPEIFLADEPVASLDPATSHSVMRYLDYANKKLGKTVVCNLHFLSLVRQYTGRAIALKAGEIIYEGSSKEIDRDWFRRIYGEEAVEVEIN